MLVLPSMQPDAVNEIAEPHAIRHDEDDIGSGPGLAGACHCYEEPRMGRHRSIEGGLDLLPRDITQFRCCPGASDAIPKAMVKITRQIRFMPTSFV